MSLFESHERAAVLPHVFRAFGRVDRGHYVGTDNRSLEVAVAWRHEMAGEEESLENRTNKRREAECTITRLEGNSSMPGVDRPQIGATITIEDAAGGSDIWKVDRIEKQTASYSDLILVYFSRMKVNRLPRQI